MASLGLLPLLLAGGIGSEAQKPRAPIALGGLVMSRLLTLGVLPAIYGWNAGWAERHQGTHGGAKSSGLPMRRRRAERPRQI